MANNMPTFTLATCFGMLAVVVTMFSTSFITIFAVLLAIARLSIGILALTTAVANMASAILLATLTYQSYQAGGRKKPAKEQSREKLVQVAAIFICITAALLAASTLAWAQITLSTLPELLLTRPTSSVFILVCALWGVALFTQLLFCFFLLRPGKSTKSHQLSPKPSPAPRPTNLPAFRPAMRENNLPAGQPSPADQPHSSPVLSTTSSDPISSLRSSLSQAIRPMNSRTKLLNRQPSFARNSGSSSLDAGLREPESPGDAFDNWDITSTVGFQARRALIHPHYVAESVGLETIPASRPDSPAHPLDGPFSSHNHSEVSISEEFFPFPDEAHLHPLFRTHSPTPPPKALPGTVVTASPLAGQTIARIPSRNRSESLPSRSAHSYADGPTRTSTPPSREITPPIPDFILSAGQRSSLVGYGKRRALIRPGTAR
ncbi:MAG: hypothetical protein M1829_001307 [Trizodia sp. TS-e1964]|nr:MAG: hypothetical protein M1829_001307 [Trizodia sp. TS-e1964]